MSSSDDWLESAEGKDPAQAARDGLSGIILAIAGGFIVVVEALFDGFSNLLDAFGAARDFLVTLLTSPTVILQQTARFTARSLTVGEWSFLGPFTFAAGVAAIVAAFWIWDRANVSLPFVDRIIPWR